MWCSVLSCVRLRVWVSKDLSREGAQWLQRLNRNPGGDEGQDAVRGWPARPEGAVRLLEGTQPPTPNTVELIPTLGALFSRGGPVQDPVLTETRLCQEQVQRYLAHKKRPTPLGFP